MIKRRKKVIIIFLSLVVFAAMFRVVFSKYFWEGDIREAIDENDMGKLEQLLEKNYDIDTNGIGENWTPLILALQIYDADDLQIVKYLI